MTSHEWAYQNLKTIGAALGRVNANNTHSGNLSVRDPKDPDLFYITASGSQIGALVPNDIVPVRFSKVSWGDTRGSTESDNHRKMLQIPETTAVVHSHGIYLCSVSFDMKEKELFMKYLGEDEKGREEFMFHPVDFFGSFVVGDVKCGTYIQPVGSAEMTERLPKYLAEDRLTIVRGHGPFARGSSLEDGLYRLTTIEISSMTIMHLRRRGVNVVKLLSEIHKKTPAVFYGIKPELMNEKELDRRDIDDSAMIADFEQRLNYNFNNLIGGYGTGSMSQRITADEMIYAPMSAVPEGMTFPLRREKIKPSENDSFDLHIHKLVYNNMNQNTCMITQNPLGNAEGMAVLAEQYGEQVLYNDNSGISYSQDDHPVLFPIDAEAIYLNPRVGLIDFKSALDRSPENPLLNMLRWYKGCCIIAGMGVVSTGETTLEQGAHNASSVERIAAFRSNVDINNQLLGGPAVKDFEPVTL